MAHSASVLVLMLCVVSGGGSQARGGAKTGRPADLIGSWHGTVGGIPAADLTIKLENGRLAGTIVLYTVVDVGSGPEVDQRTEEPLLEPSFDGKVLTFKFKQRDDDERVTLSLTLVGTDAGNLKESNPTEDDEPVIIKMARVK